MERKEKSDWVSKCREIQVAGVRGRGRGKKTWMEGIKEDMKKLDLKNSDALDRVEWRKKIWGNRPTHASMD